MKTSLKLAAILFLSTLFLNVSFDSSGHFKLISPAKAELSGWKTMTAYCASTKTNITVCGAGSDADCTPSGTCGN